MTMCTVSVLLAVLSIVRANCFDVDQTPAVEDVSDVVESEILYYDDAESIFWEQSVFEMRLNNRQESPIQFLTQPNVEKSFDYLRQKQLWTNLTDLDGLTTHYQATGHLRMVYSLRGTKQDITLTGTAVFYQPNLLITAAHNTWHCKCIYKLSNGQRRIYKCQSDGTCPRQAKSGFLKDLYVCVRENGCLDEEARIHVNVLDRSHTGNKFGWKYADDVARLETPNYRSDDYVNLVSFNEFEKRFEKKIEQVVLVGFPFVGSLMKGKKDLVEIGASGNEYMVSAEKLAKLFSNYPLFTRKTVMIANVSKDIESKYSEYKAFHDGATYGGTSGAIACVVGHEQFCVGIHVGGQASDGYNTLFTTDHPFLSKHTTPIDALCKDNVCESDN